MSREIIFRGKSLKTGEWIYGDLVQWKSKGLYAVLPQEGHLWHNVNDFQVDPKTVGQYTGEQDIYEGDIIAHEYDDTCEENGKGRCTGTVVFENGCFVVKQPDFDYESAGETPFTLHRWLTDDKCEIIGNIHETGKEVKQ